MKSALPEKCPHCGHVDFPRAKFPEATVSIFDQSGLILESWILPSFQEATDFAQARHENDPLVRIEVNQELFR